LDFAIIDIKLANIVYKGDILTNNAIYKMIDFGGMVPIY